MYEWETNTFDGHDRLHYVHSEGNTPAALRIIIGIAHVLASDISCFMFLLNTRMRRMQVKSRNEKV